MVCEDEERLEEFLIELVENGWLIESDGGYKFHQILKEFILENYTPIFEEIEKQIDSFTNVIEDMDNLVYFEFIVDFIKKIGMENERIATFFNNLGVVYYYLDNPRAELFFLKALKIREEIFGENHFTIDQSHNNLLAVYRRQIPEYKITVLTEPILIMSLKENISKSKKWSSI